MNRLNRIVLCLTVLLANVNLPVYTAQTAAQAAGRTAAKVAPRFKWTKRAAVGTGLGYYWWDQQNELQDLRARIAHTDKNLVKTQQSSIAGDETTHRALKVASPVWDRISPYDSSYVSPHARLWQLTRPKFQALTDSEFMQNIFKINPTGESALSLYMKYKIQNLLKNPEIEKPATLAPTPKQPSPAGKNVATPEQAKPADTLNRDDWNFF